MSLDFKHLVDLPEHVVFQKKDGNKYAYYTTKSFRNSKGRPDNKRVCIGKYDENTGKLIPNGKYYELFDLNTPVHLPDIIRRCGSYAVCRSLAEKLDLLQILKDVFPFDYEEILTGAHYMLTSGSVMYYLDDWLDETVSFTPDVLDDVAIGRMFKTINDEKRNEFFRTWMSKKGRKEFIAYDVTSISSYSRSLENVEYGYNRDKEKLPQINYGMYLGEESRIPFYYRVYPGSINDKTHCESMIEGTDWLDFKNAYFVMDKGFFTNENLKFITEKGHRFMITMPPSLKAYKTLIDENKADVINNIEYKVRGRLMYCKKVEKNLYGFRMNVHIFYNQDKAADNSRALYTKLEAMEKDISEMKVVPSVNSSYCDYFRFTQKDGYVVAERRTDEIKKALDRCGFFAICETAFSKTSEEILDIYSDRDSIEKCFDDLKNEIDLDRIRCSTEETAEGKMFVAFISLILLSQLRKALKEYGRKNKYTMKKMILELDKIKIAYDSSKPEQYRLLNPITKKQREILDQLNMNEDIFKNLFK